MKKYISSLLLASLLTGIPAPLYALEETEDIDVWQNQEEAAANGQEQVEAGEILEISQEEAEEEPALLAKNEKSQKTGFEEENNQVYFRDEQGNRQKGWILFDEDWMYFDEEDGHLYRKAWIDDYYVNEQGIWIPNKWEKNNGIWYYHLGDGTLAKDGFRQVSDGKTYYFLKDGAMFTGLLTENGDTYYFEAGGSMVKDRWIQKNGSWMYFAREDGKMVRSTWIGDWYVNEQGIWIPNRWSLENGIWYYHLGDGNLAADGFYSIDGRTYYFDTAGAMKTGWVQTNGKYYYLDRTGALVCNRWIETWYVGEDGAWVPTSWQKDPQTGRWWLRWGDGSRPVSQLVTLSSQTYWFDEDGFMYTGWLSQNGNWYFFDSNGAMVRSKMVDGWYLNSQGIGFGGHDVEIAQYCDAIYQETGSNFYQAYLWVVKNLNYKKLPIPLELVNGYNTVQNYFYQAMTGEGNCFCYASMVYYLAKGLGYDPTFVEGGVLLANGGISIHGWVSIMENGVEYFYDAEAQWETGNTRNFFRIPASNPPIRYVRN